MYLLYRNKILRILIGQLPVLHILMYYGKNLNIQSKTIFDSGAK